MNLASMQFVRALCVSAIIKLCECTVQAAVYGAGSVSLLLSYSPAILSMSLVPGQKSSKNFSRARSLHFTLISTKPGIKVYKYFNNCFRLLKGKYKGLMPDNNNWSCLQERINKPCKIDTTTSFYWLIIQFSIAW